MNHLRVGSVPKLSMDRLLLQLDVGPAGALWRSVVGAAFGYGLSRVNPGAGTAAALFCLAGNLFAVKAVAAVARRFARASPGVREVWAWRRMLAAEYDSYQWRKLVWYGLGILGSPAVTGSRSGWEASAGLACLTAGAAAELVWRRQGVAPPSSLRS